MVGPDDINLHSPSSLSAEYLAPLSVCLAVAYSTDYGVLYTLISKLFFSELASATLTAREVYTILIYKQIVSFSLHLSLLSDNVPSGSSYVTSRSDLVLLSTFPGPIPDTDRPVYQIARGARCVGISPDICFQTINDERDSTSEGEDERIG